LAEIEDVARAGVLAKGQERSVEGDGGLVGKPQTGRAERSDEGLDQKGEDAWRKVVAPLGQAYPYPDGLTPLTVVSPFLGAEIFVEPLLVKLPVSSDSTTIGCQR